MESTECSRLSTVIEKITHDVTKALERNLGEIIENEKNVNTCLMNIPQIKCLGEENDQLKKENQTLKSINSAIQERNQHQSITIDGLQHRIKGLIENGALRINTNFKNHTDKEPPFADTRIIRGQRDCLIKLRAEVKELKEQIKNTNTENNISLEVEEYEKKNEDDESVSICDEFTKNTEHQPQNEILVSHIQLDKAAENNISLEEACQLDEDSEEDSDSDSDSESDSEDDSLMIAHWANEKKKLDNLNKTVSIHLEMNEEIPEPDKERDFSVDGTLEEEEEEEEVEEYEFMLNGEVLKVYRSNTGNIYQILEDEEAGELMGTINDTGEFISL